MNTHTITPIAHIHSNFPEKFGIPRQSNLVEDTQASIVFEPAYRVPDAFRGLEEYSHIWLIWEFSESIRENWSPTVRPPRLGGNQRVGVFATRSPFRPNPLGLSCVRLESIEMIDEQGPVLHILGADLLDGTPIYDIKPYLPYVDSHPEAAESFSGTHKEYRLDIDCPTELLAKIPAQHKRALLEILAQDPRPSYQNNPERIYGMKYANMNVKFYVDGNTLHLCKIE